MASCPNTPLLQNNYLLPNNTDSIEIKILKKSLFVNKRYFYYLASIPHTITQFIIDLYTFHLIQSLIGSALIHCIPRYSKYIQTICSILIRVFQLLIFTTILLILLLQILLLAVDPNSYCVTNSSVLPLNSTDILFEDIFLVTANVTFSFLSVGSIYFLYINSCIIRELNFDVHKPIPFNSITIQFPTGRNPYLPPLLVAIAHIFILITLCYATYAKQLSSDNYFFLQELLTLFSCPDESLDLYQTIGSIQYVFLSTLYVFWHMSPVIACTVVRFVCNKLQQETDRVVDKIKSDILEFKINQIAQKNPKILLGFYDLIELITNCSNRLFYVSTLNIATVLVVVANLFGNFVSNSFQGSVLTYGESSRTEAKYYEYLWLTLISIYLITSVLLMSASIISLNAKLTKFSDSVLSDRRIRGFLHEESEKRLVLSLRQDLLLVSASKARFEIALLGDMSSGFVYGIILIGITLLMASIADVYYLTIVTTTMKLYSIHCF